MDVIKTIAPGQKGSIKFLKEWGEQLVTVRYRKSPETTQILTTIEIVVDRHPMAEPDTHIRGLLTHNNKQPVALKIYYQEEELRRRGKQAGALWSKQLKLWITKREIAVSLGLLDRVVENAAEACADIDTSLL